MQRDIPQLQQNRFDVIIVGAGIHGACAARDAALRGLKVALIDKGDLCGATSHNSLKTIHGGIRYLQHFNIKRTLESINEQKFWLRTAPHLVKLLPFLMPTYGFGLRGNEAILAGIKAYEALGFGRNKTIPAERKIPKGQIISAQECLQHVPGLDAEGLRGGAIWYDAQVEKPDHTVIQIVQHAVHHGACAANYVRAQELLVEHHRVQGLIAKDELSGETFHILGKTVINATGPWAGSWLAENQQHLSKTHPLPLTKSMNIVTRQLFPSHAIGIKSELNSDAAMGQNKRLYFVVPWRNMSIIGTTHFHYDGDINTATGSHKTTRQEIQQFIQEINQAYPAAKLTLEDVVYCYQGLTPANEPGQHPQASRLHHSKVIDHATEDKLNGLISMISVKWTTARAVAEQAIDLVAQKLGNHEPCQTHRTSIPNTSLDLNLDENTSHLELEHFINHAINNEMALSIADLLFRRCDAMMTHQLSIEQIQFIFSFMGKQLNWDEQEQQRQKAILLQSWLQPGLHTALTESLQVSQAG